MEFICNLRPRHPALKLLFKGTAVGCGSQCFQIDPFKGPNEFLGKLPDAAKEEVWQYLYGKRPAKNYNRVVLISLWMYINKE